MPPLLRFLALLAAGAIAGAAHGRSGLEQGLAPTAAITALTIAVAPNPATAWTATLVSGRAKGARSDGARVTLWRRLASQQQFHVAFRTLTDDTGHYTVALPSERGQDQRRVVRHRRRHEQPRVDAGASTRS